MRWLVALGFGLLAPLGLGLPFPAAQDRTQTDRQGAVVVSVTPAAPLTTGTPLEARVVLDTHSVALDGIAFDTAVTLRTPDGAETAPTAVQAKGAGHHREAILTFAAPTRPGPVQIVVRNVGGVAERTFTWELR